MAYPAVSQEKSAFSVPFPLQPPNPYSLTRHPVGLTQGILEYNKALQAELDEARASEEAARTREARLLEAERAAAADADTLRASLAKASTATGAAAAAAAAAEAKATAYAAAKVDAERDARAASRREAKAAAARELEVRKLEETVACLQRGAPQEGARSKEAERPLEARIEEAVAAVAEERNAWAVRSGEWEGKAERLAGELQASDEKAADLQRELEAAVAMARDLVASEREVEEEAAAARAGEAEQRDEHEVNQIRGDVKCHDVRHCDIRVCWWWYLFLPFVADRLAAS